MKLDADAARARGRGRRRARSASDRAETALAIVRIADNNMVGALRSVLIERGLDPRDFTLCAFGGAGPLHAAALMREMGIPRGDRPQPSGPVLGLRLHPDRRPRRPAAHDPAHHQPLRPGAGRARSWRRWSTEAAAELAEQGYSSGIEVAARRWRCAISARTTSWSCRSAPTRSTDDADRAALAGLPRRPRGPLRLRHPGRDHRDRQLHRDRALAHRQARAAAARRRPRARPSPSAERQVRYRRRRGRRRRSTAATTCAPATRSPARR